MSGPRLALREVQHGRHRVDLLLYDDVLAVAPSPGGSGGAGAGPYAWLLAGVFWLLGGGTWLERGRARREAARRWPRRTKVIPLASVGSVLVRLRPYGAATLVVDGVTYEIPESSAYRAPWDELLGPLFGDRLRVE